MHIRTYIYIIMYKHTNDPSDKTQSRFRVRRGGAKPFIYIYIYMEREREREREICIYMRERTINVGSLCRLSSVP